MKAVAYITHPEYRKHDTGLGHPERPQRLEAITGHLQTTNIWSSLRRLEPQPAELRWVEQCHPREFIASIQNKCESGVQRLDGGDTVVCEDSFRVAMLAAGAAVRAVDEVCGKDSGTLKAFCAVRPPGHHAETKRVMGFCLFNNVAIAARYAQKQFGLDRIAIVDWDVHHGNGTQEIFWSDPSVLYISLHQFPLWPGTGAANEVGGGKGEGTTLNCPMKPGSGEAEYLAEFHSKVLPALDKFRPELLLISAGFDAHKDDPLANIQLTEQSFGTMTTMLCHVAERHCGGRLVSVLEGGYNLNALAASVDIHLQKLQEES